MKKNDQNIGPCSGRMMQDAPARMKRRVTLRLRVDEAEEDAIKRAFGPLFLCVPLNFGRAASLLVPFGAEGECAL